MINTYRKIILRFWRKENSVEDNKMLNRLLDNPNIFDEWLQNEWEQASDEIDERIERKMFRHIVSQTNTKKNRYTFFLSVAASVIIFMLLGTWLIFNSASLQNKSVNNLIVTVEKGQKANVVLPDGTKVWMNSDTELTYNPDFDESERCINLVGEAYFDVAKDSQRPFIVKTPSMTVKALGTVFNVRAYENDCEIETTLLEGAVEVDTKNNKQILKPNQRITFNRQTKQTELKEDEDLKNLIAWKNNAFYFADDSFETIARILNRQYNVDIIFEDEALKKMSFSGTISNTSLESILELFTLTSPLSYHMADTVVVLKVDKNAIDDYNKIVRSRK
ncbi:MAG: FecR family protein [Bacteroidales bacterium]